MDLACDRVNWRLKKGKDCETKQDEAKCPAKSVFLPFSMISVHLILKILFFFSNGISFGVSLCIAHIGRFPFEA